MLRAVVSSAELSTAGRVVGWASGLVGHPDAMKIEPRAAVGHVVDSHGILLRRDAVATGVSDVALARLVDNGVLIKLRHGCYCLRSVYLAASRDERHRLLCRAVMKLYGSHVALSHGSSCLMQGGPDVGLDLNKAHLTHLSGGGRATSRVRHHLGELRVGDVRRHQGHWITTPPRAVLEVAITDGVEAALVQANHFLHRREMYREDLVACAEAQTFWPGSLTHHPVMHLADPRPESPGESRCVYCFFSQGLPAPIPQFEVLHPDGTVAARCDFAWPERRVIVEFDGLEKYHRFRKDGETIEQTVMREKAREDVVRGLTGWTVVRITWADLARPVSVANRIRAAFAMAAA
ncbi:type IV toxin-antitoxin system AbiEi family antitoxin domain-containing protein [Nocardioides sp. C4-1]|uniref:type IV toxin-antitoxin system AbiEi family antitoxin domain-containing protein n=1 Tax=Nocardioides sp. C4-1 TaxID=3151851 RepID=UPI0032653943